jgi:hypothetical protein
VTKTEPQATPLGGPLTKTRFKYPINPEWQISFCIGIDPQEVFPPIQGTHHWSGHRDQSEHGNRVGGRTDYTAPKGEIIEQSQR